MTENERLMGRLAEIVRLLREEGLDPVLIGGLAVYLRRHRFDLDPDVRAPGYLASVPRTTSDVDFAIRYAEGAEKRAAAALKSLGIAPTSTNSWCLIGEDVQIDLVPCLDKWSAHTKFVVEKGREARPLAPDRVSTYALTDDAEIRVSDRAMLVLQKTIAWGDRRKQSDLADIAALALADQVERGSATEDLEALIGTLPVEFAELLRKVAVRFSDEDCRGPLDFYYSVEGALRQRHIRLGEDDEERIRQLASLAVRQLLGPWC